jgi:hypothetical protein
MDCQPRPRQESSAGSWREFGLLENLQHAILIAILVISLLAVRRKETKIEQAGFLGLAAFTLFVFLEEIDYGLHYYEFIMNISWKDVAQVRNWHNQGDRTRLFKIATDAGMILMFVIAPFALRGIQNRWVQYLIPDRWCLATMIAAYLIRTTAHSLQDAGFGNPGSIDNNLSEFRELITYYLACIYVVNIVFFPHAGAAK